MSREWRLLLADIHDGCIKVQRYTSGMSFEEFEKNDLVIDATIRNLEIIGEACKHVPKHIQALLPDIAWSSAAKFRDYIAHHYFGVNTMVVWDVATVEIPIIRASLEPLLTESDITPAGR